MVRRDGFSRSHFAVRLIELAAVVDAIEARELVESGAVAAARTALADRRPVPLLALRALDGIEALARAEGRSAPVSDGVTVAEFALATGRPVSTVRRWCQLGRLPAEQVGGRWLIERPAQRSRPSG